MAIESVLASDYPNFELIILDDYSTDKTVKIAKSYEERDARVRVYINEKNLGQFPNRNKALTYANGEFIKFLDSDDVMHPDSLSTMVNALMEFPDAIAGGGVGNDGHHFPVLFTPREMYVNFFNGNNLLSIIPSSVIFRKELFTEMGDFPTNVGTFGDTLFMLQARARFSWVGFRPDTFFYRIHEGQELDIGSRDRVKAIYHWHYIIETLMNSAYCPLTFSEKQVVLRNAKNIAVRNILKSLLSGNVKFALRLQRQMRFTIKDYIVACRRNKILTA